MGFFANILQSAQIASTSSSSVMGVDIGSSAIKVVELEDRDGVLTLITYGEVQLGPYADQDLGATVHLNQKQEQEAFVDVVRESAIKSREAVFAMPLSASFISTTTLDADPEADLSAMVRVEARKLIPASLSEVTLDWAELDTVSKQQTGRPVLIAAIQNAAIERFKILMQFAGFKDAPTEIECFSANRAAAQKSNTMIIDFGAASSKMYLSHDGVLNRMHRINSGGVDITKKFAEALDISFEEAENEKLQMTPDDENYETLQSVYTKHYGRALREFKQVFDHYQLDTGATFDQAMICGGASAFPGLPAIVKDRLGLDVEYIDPFKKVAYPAFMEDTIHVIGPSFVPAMGAALRMFE